MAGMALLSMLRLLILSTLAFDWYGAAGMVVRAVEYEEYPRRKSFHSWKRIFAKGKLMKKI